MTTKLSGPDSWRVDERLSAAIARSAQLASSANELDERLIEAMARSTELLVAARMSCEESRSRRLSSRAHLLFARLEGEVDGQQVEATVRIDSSISADTTLLEQAQLVVALSDTLDDGGLVASLSSGPLIATLTLIRACDWVTALEMPIVSPNPRPPHCRPSAG